MRIIFNLMSTSLGDNGGSFTLIKSANALQSLGHDVTIIDSMKNCHTWTPLKAKHLIIKDINKIPNADIIIATGVNSVKSTIAIPNRCGKKFIYMRGWELWKMNESNLVKKVLKTPLIKIVNGIGLQKKLKEYNINSYLIRPGNDFENFYPMNIRDNNKIILGGLYHTRHKTKRSEWILNATKVLKKRNKKIVLWMYGTPKNPNNPIIDKYIRLPDMNTKNYFYNKVNIWLSPSELEGLHIVPQEAMLTDCAVITTNAKLSGTQDYINHYKTGIISDNNFDSFLEQISETIKDKDLIKYIGIAGKNKIIKLGNRIDNMNKMITLFKKLV